ncbi:type II secretion system F family protein [Sphingomicrobium lutaoense]|uniref:Tight adherence protein B n=1 Tax=Sphingomicrobium lutaoense TaxID=515949 RepID=A0A839Z3M4_9SPHN|nr:type II secretion system F family protein [Sphingomicrobium lutaoense]MBB3764687.1 tight adherence protein B [Sphingomicrobium lutaoense]
MPDTFFRALVLILVFAAVLIAVERLVAATASRRGDSRAVNKRLAMIDKGMSREDTLTILRRQGFDPKGELPGPLSRIGNRLHQLLIQAGVSAPNSQIIMFIMALPAVVFMLLLGFMVLTGAVISPGRLFLLAIVGIVLGGLLPVSYLRFRAARRRKKMQEQFPVALDIFVRGLRAGHPVAAALDLLTVEMEDPIGSEFGLVVDEVTYGADLRDALEAMAERWDLDDIRMFVVSLSVQAETGGNLAEILENLSKVIRDRAALFMKVRALSSEGRMTALMLSVLPLFALMIVFFGNPDFYFDVADDPAFIPSFAVLVLMWILGVMMIRKMIDLKV